MTSSKINAIEFHQTNWQKSSDEILAVRHKVFMIEQHFNDQVLCDMEDNNCFHLVVRNTDGMVIASGRLTHQGRIGRIAVMLPYRGIGIGSKLLEELIRMGRENNIQIVSLNAELDNCHFYNEQQFSAAGPVFMKQGVPHQMLARKLA